MKYRNALLILTFVLSGIALAGCGNNDAASEHVEPIHIEAIEGSDVNQLTLTERAAQRLDVQTTAVNEATLDETTYLVVPYSSIIYDLTGNVWVYISPTPLNYYREQVSVEVIEGDSVLLSIGPPVGTQVVTTAVAELYGADTGVGK